MPAGWVCPVLPVWYWSLVAVAVVWSTVWKGIALWRAGRNGHLAWFIAMLIVNTLGILEIIYIFAFSRRK
jgi:methionyl-tRNA synthetase